MTENTSAAATAPAADLVPPKVDSVTFEQRPFWLGQFTCSHPDAPDSPLSQACVFAEDFDDARNAIEDAVVGQVLHQREVLGITFISLARQHLPPVLPN